MSDAPPSLVPSPTSSPNDQLRKPDTPTWTVMIFMGVATIEGKESLEQAADDDLAEIQAIGGGGPHHLNVTIQQHGRDKNPKRFHFGAASDGTPIEVPPDQRDYRDGRALSDFIRFSLKAANHRDLDHTMLVLWGHAYDFAFGRLLTPGGGMMALNFTAIRDVLRKLQADADRVMDPGDENPFPPKIDILGFDACDIATSELAYQLQPVARFLLASQVGIPVPGWPYHRILDRLKEPKGDRIMSPAELGSYAVRRFCAAYDASTPVSLTMLNLLHGDELFRLTQDVAIELATAIENSETRDRMARTFQRSQTELGKPFVDVADLCLSLLDESDYPGLVEKARALGDFVAGSRPDVSAPYEEPAGWPLVVDHDRNAGELVRLNGVSLYAPNVAPPEDQEGVSSVYRMLDFVRHGRWSGVVHRLAPARDRFNGDATK